MSNLTGMEIAQNERDVVGGDLRVRGDDRTAVVPSTVRGGPRPLRARHWGPAAPCPEYDSRGHRRFQERDVIAIRRAAANGVPLSLIAEQHRARVTTIRRIVEWETYRLVGLRDHRHLQRLKAKTAARLAVDTGPSNSTSAPDEARTHIGTDRP